MIQYAVQIIVTIIVGVFCYHQGVRERNKPICGCGDHFVTHDQKTFKCTVQDDKGCCACHRYYGPAPKPEYLVASTRLDSLDGM